MEIVSLSKQTSPHLAHLFCEMWPEETIRYVSFMKDLGQ